MRYFLISIFLILQISISYAQEISFPGKAWQLTDPQIYNISQSAIDSVGDYFDEIGGDALMIVYKGNLIASFGDVEDKIQCRSIRKSFLSACFGVYRDSFDLNLSLADLKIDDKNGLTSIEKTATIKNLLTSSSGIFHPAAYEPFGAEDRKPARGSFKPGEKFFYNNWDFNVLGTIFNKLSKHDLFEVFQKDIAQKIAMQDFSLEDTEYEYDSDSYYPAYLFDMSARDCARFGLLYLANGRWKNKQILAESWVRESTRLHVDFKNTNGYSYMWWLTTDDYDESQWSYLARGNSGQYIYVNPYRALVIVFRADPGTIIKKWLGLRVDWSESVRLIPMINGILDPVDSN